MENNRRHHHSLKHKLKRIYKENKKWLFIILIVFIFLLAFVIDNYHKNVSLEENNIENNVFKDEKNYDAIITIVDGEGEINFTKNWGKLISEGYPICSDLVIDYVGKENYMDWETIESLNNVGVEFLFHSCSHKSYNNMNKEELLYEFENGTKIMEEHNLEHNVICWLSGTERSIVDYVTQYFKAGISDYESTSTLEGDKSDPYKIKNVFGSSDNEYYSYQQLKQLIDTAIQNNGWVVIFTRNNHKMMDSTQIDIYRQAFEYAKEHNVAVVTASEGYDLYYGNKLGNNK